MMFCHKLYIIECINLIINKEAHLLLTVGNKIVTNWHFYVSLVDFLKTKILIYSVSTNYIS